MSNGPETAFFAAVLFRTYWVVEAKRARAEVQERSEVVGYEAVDGGREVIGELDGERELAFDFALAAIALAVKVRLLLFLFLILSPRLTRWVKVRPRCSASSASSFCA